MNEACELFVDRVGIGRRSWLDCDSFESDEAWDKADCGGGDAVSCVSCVNKGGRFGGVVVCDGIGVEGGDLSKRLPSRLGISGCMVRKS